MAFGCYGPHNTLDGSATTKEACDELSKDWKDPDDKTPWDVFIKDLLRIEVLIGENVLQIAVDIRNEMMPTTLVGERLLQIYNTHFGEAVRVMRRDDQLSLSALQAWASLLPFANQMLSVTRGKKARDMRFEQKTFKLVSNLCDSLATASRKEGFRRAVVEVKTECRRYVGLTPREAIRISSRELPEGSLGGRASSQPSKRRAEGGRTGTIRRKANIRRR